MADSDAVVPEYKQINQCHHVHMELADQHRVSGGILYQPGTNQLDHFKHQHRNRAHPDADQFLWNGPTAVLSHPLAHELIALKFHRFLSGVASPK